MVENPETGPKSIGIGVYLSVGTAPGILGLDSSALGAERDPTSTIFGRILKRFSGLFYQKEPEVVLWPSGFLEAWGSKAKKPHIFHTIVFF